MVRVCADLTEAFVRSTVKLWGGHFWSTTVTSVRRWLHSRRLIITVASCASIGTLAVALASRDGSGIANYGSQSITESESHDAHQIAKTKIKRENLDYSADHYMSDEANVHFYLVESRQQVLAEATAAQFLHN